MPVHRDIHPECTMATDTKPGSDDCDVCEHVSLTSSHTDQGQKLRTTKESGEITDLLVWYAKNSTMHGIPSIVGSEMYRGRHVFWSIIVCLMAILLGSTMYAQMHDYYDYPTVTSVDISYVNEEDFPAVTICDPNIGIKRFFDMLKMDQWTQFNMASLTEIEGFYFQFMKRMEEKDTLFKPNKTEESIEQVKKFISLASAVIGNSKYNPLWCSWGDYYWKVPCPASNVVLTSLGVCATIDVTKLRTDLKTDPRLTNNRSQKGKAIGNAMRGLTVYLDNIFADMDFRLHTVQGFKVVLHDPHEAPLPAAGGILIPGNTVVEVEVSKQVKIGLPPPFTAFGSGVCVDTESPDFKSDPKYKLKRFENYTKEVCEQECFMDYTIKVCGGCRHFLFPGNETVCELDHLAKCYRIAQVNYYGHGDNDTDIRPESCGCQMPCKQVSYRASVTSAAFTKTEYLKELEAKQNKTVKATVSYVHVYFSDPVVTTLQQVAVHTVEGLLGTIGGQIGLFLGFSLVTLAEVLELLFLLCTRGRRTREHKRRKEAALKASLSSRNGVI